MLGRFSSHVAVFEAYVIYSNKPVAVSTLFISRYSPIWYILL